MDQYFWIVTALILIAGLGAMLAQQKHQQYKTVTPEEVQALVNTKKNIVLLDVRTPGEFNSETGHLKGAILIPVQELHERIIELDPYKEKMIVAYCRSGNRSGRAASILTAAGFNAVNLVGGILRWTAEQHPLVTENKVTE